MAESYHDKLLGVEMGGITWANLSYTSATQHGYCGWVEAEEVEQPAIWTTALCPIKEGPIAGVQQALPKLPAMAIRDEAFTRQRDRNRFNVAPQ